LRCCFCRRLSPFSPPASRRFRDCPLSCLSREEGRAFLLCSSPIVKPLAQALYENSFSDSSLCGRSCERTALSYANGGDSRNPAAHRRGGKDSDAHPHAAMKSPTGIPSFSRHFVSCLGYTSRSVPWQPNVNCFPPADSKLRQSFVGLIVGLHPKPRVLAVTEPAVAAEGELVTCGAFSQRFWR
jgi:hypothetical protein